MLVISPPMVFSHGGDVKIFPRSRWVTTAAGLCGQRSGANQVDRPIEYASVQPQQEAIVSLPLLHCGFLGFWPFLAFSGSDPILAPTPFPTRSNSSSPSGRSSPALQRFCFFSLCLVPDLPALRSSALVISILFLTLVVAKSCTWRGWIWATGKRWWYSASRRSGRTG